MSLATSNSYREWRHDHGLPAALREGPGHHPTERLVQAIWARQRIRREQLVALDGRPVEVLHPGFWNRESGPDFSGAVIRIGNESPASGDVEVDLQSSGWRAHKHDVNPAFRNVILHVVWAAEGAPAPDRPTLVLQPRVDAALGELQELLAGETPPPLAEAMQGRCSAPLRELPPDRLRELLRQAAGIRLEARASQLLARARVAGWEQALMEGLLRALGYKHNSWPMQRLGELSPRLRERLAAERETRNADAWQALLLGVSGLLPDELTRREQSTDDHLRRTWHRWWRERDACSGLVLPRALWRLQGLRPANHPHRRLALAAHWLADVTLPDRLEEWFGQLTSAGADEMRPSLAKTAEALFVTLNPTDDAFWSRHWTLRSKPMNRPQPLLGHARLTDLAINVILPWFFVRTREGRNDHWRDTAERLWFAWPGAEDNTVLRQARARLLGNARRNVLKSAAEQQGVLQIVRDFCDHSNAICKDCRFPGLVSGWRL